MTKSPHPPEFPNHAAEDLGQALVRLEEKSGAAAVKQAFELLACSEDGLDEHELLELMGGPDGPFPSTAWENLLREAAIFFTVEEPRRHISFRHDRFRDAVLHRYVPDGKAERRVCSVLAKYAYRRYLTASAGTEEGMEDGTVRRAGVFCIRAGLYFRIFDLIASLFSLPEERFRIFRTVFDLAAEWAASASVPDEDPVFLPALRAVLDALVITRNDRNGLWPIIMCLSEHAHAAKERNGRAWREAFANEALRVIEAALRVKAKKSTRIPSAEFHKLRNTLLAAFLPNNADSPE